MNKAIFKISGLVFLFTLVLYTVTLHPFFPIGDSGELIVAAKTFGVSHPPGAPLYAIVSSIIAAIPLGTLIGRLNVVSAFFGSLTIAGMFLLMYRLTSNWLAALTGALLLAFSYIFWFFSIITEVYTLNLFLFTLLLLFFTGWYFNKNDRLLYAIALVGGLSLTVHYVSIVLLVLIALFVSLSHKKQTRPLTFFLLPIFYFFLGLIPLVILPVAARNHSFVNWGNIASVTDFFRFISRSDYQVVGGGGKEGFSFYNALTQQIPYYILVLNNVFSVLGLGLVIISLFRKMHRPLVVFYALCFLLFGPVFVIYSNFSLTSPDPIAIVNHKRLMEQVYIFSLPFVSVLVALGVDTIWKQVSLFQNSRIKGIGTGILFFWILYNLFTNYPQIKSVRNTVLRDYGKSVLQTIQGPTLLITGTEQANVLGYLYAVEEVGKNDVRLITFSLLQKDWYVRDLKQRYTDVIFPFDHIRVGEKLDSFYEENLTKFSILFAPLNVQALASVSDRFQLFPYGLTTQLLPKTTIISKEAFEEKNRTLVKTILQNEHIVNKKYVDLPTNELLMSYTNSFTNIAIRNKKLGNNTEALFYLDKAAEIQPSYYTSYLVAASMYEEDNKYAESIREHKRVLAVNPKHLLSLRNISIDYFKIRDVNNALLFAQQYSRYAQTDEEKTQARNLLELFSSGQ